MSLFYVYSIGYEPKLPNSIISIPDIIMTTNPKTPIVEITKVTPFKSPLALNNAVKNESNNNRPNNTVSHESGKGLKNLRKIPQKNNKQHILIH